MASSRLPHLRNRGKGPLRWRGITNLDVPRVDNMRAIYSRLQARINRA
jgi:hypothetical protein